MLFRSLLEVLETVRGDVLEGRHHADPVGSQPRDQLGARALPDPEHARRAVAHRGRERHAHRHQDLPGAQSLRDAPHTDSGDVWRHALGWDCGILKNKNEFFKSKTTGCGLGPTTDISPFNTFKI